MPLLPPVEVDGLTLRELPPEEWWKLAEASGPLSGWQIPAGSDSARILVAEDPTVGGDIVAYWVIAAMVHLDPLWIDAPYRGRAHFLMALIGALITILGESGVHYTYAIVGDGDQPANGILAEKLGLSKVPGTLYGGSLTAPKG